jgi:hypothetical protein
MILEIQIKMLLFSFLYGILFSFLVSLCAKLLYNKKIIIRLLFTFFFVIINTLIYFVGMKKINDAIIHPYAILMLIIGYIVEIFLKQVIVKYIKK